jgi:hypothetical protein
MSWPLFPEKTRQKLTASTLFVVMAIEYQLSPFYPTSDPKRSTFDSQTHRLQLWRCQSVRHATKVTTSRQTNIDLCLIRSRWGQDLFLKPLPSGGRQKDACEPKLTVKRGQTHIPVVRFAVSDTGVCMHCWIYAGSVSCISELSGTLYNASRAVSSSVSPIVRKPVLSTPKSIHLCIVPSYDVRPD